MPFNHPSSIVLEQQLRLAVNLLRAEHGARIFAVTSVPVPNPSRTTQDDDVLDPATVALMRRFGYVPVLTDPVSQLTEWLPRDQTGRGTYASGTAGGRPACASHRVHGVAEAVVARRASQREIGERSQRHGQRREQQRAWRDPDRAGLLLRQRGRQQQRQQLVAGDGPLIAAGVHHHLLRNRRARAGSAARRA